MENFDWFAGLVGAGVGGAVGIVFGAWVKHLFDLRLKRKTEPLKSVSCSATYCVGLLAHSTVGIGEQIEVRMHGRALAEPVVVTYHIYANGNTTAKDVKMRLVASGSDRIVSYQVGVDEDVKCARLTHNQTQPTSVDLVWTYINPGDYLSITALVSPCKRVEDMRLEIDAEGLVVRHCGMQMDCSAPEFGLDTPR